jgi:predicted metallopeptidase
MKYEFAEDLQTRMINIVKALALDHVDLERVKCFRSYGSSTKRTLARCHTIGKLMQKSMGVKAHYAIEFLEKFEKLPRAEQDKVIIHELLHIPKTFGGGFRQHDYVCEENVEQLHKQFLSAIGESPQQQRFRFF